MMYGSEKESRLARFAARELRIYIWFYRKLRRNLL